MRPRLQIARSALQNLDRNKDSPPIMSKLVILPEIAIDESEIEERFILSSGAGGQNVNKVASAVQLRFDVRRSPSLPEEIRARLAAPAGHRLRKGRGPPRPPANKGRAPPHRGAAVPRPGPHRSRCSRPPVRSDPSRSRGAQVAQEDQADQGEQGASHRREESERAAQEAARQET